eukprot:CCRYP_000744-RG/>CCRYP_000744-RG protein AED:0.48 eAED:0.48 QI:0/0/0/1/0/0/3/0/201
MEAAAMTFFSFWYDIPSQRFCVLTSSNSRGAPTCVASYSTDVPSAKTYNTWSKSVSLRYLLTEDRSEADAKVDAFNLPPTARVPRWCPESSSMQVAGIFIGLPAMLHAKCTLLGPDFPGLFWGDRNRSAYHLRPLQQRAFVMPLQRTEKKAAWLELFDVKQSTETVEAVGHVMRERGFSGGPVAGGPRVKTPFLQLDYFAK